jgi:hypothetical protein
MDTKLIKDLLSQEDISSIFKSIQDELDSRPVIKEDRPTSTVHPDDATLYWKDFGRIDIRYPKISQHIIDKVFDIVKEKADPVFKDLKFQFVIYAEYSTMSGGNPMLNPHFDVSDNSTLFLDYQLDSNTSWPIVVENDSFDLNNNDSLLFESVENIHYRPVKNFSDKEFVKMLFFRFSTSKILPEKTNEDYKRLYEIEIKYDPSKDIGRG